MQKHVQNTYGNLKLVYYKHLVLPVFFVEQIRILKQVQAHHDLSLKFKFSDDKFNVTVGLMID